MSAFPSPEQLAAMAKEYSMVRPMPPSPPPPWEWADLCRSVSKLAALVAPLATVQNRVFADVAERVVVAVRQMQAHIDALDGRDRACEVEAPYYRGVGDLLRQSLLASAEVTAELYRPREGKTLAEQLPYLVSLAHYAHSLLLTLAAI